MKLHNLIIMFFVVLIVIGCNSKPRDIYFDGNTYSPEENADSEQVKYSIESNIISHSKVPHLYLQQRGQSVEVTYDGQRYLVSGTVDNLKVEYPDGNTYSYNRRTSGSVTVSSGSGSPVGYPELEDFSVFVEMKKGNLSVDGSELGLGFLLLVFGAIGAASPRLSWYLSKGWMYKELEPSDLYLGFARVGGFIVVGVGFIMMVSSCS